MTLQFILRLVHVLGGAFWFGTMIFNAVFLLPAFRVAGPAGAKVAEGIARRKFMQVMPIVAILTIVSGFWLYSRASGGFQPGYMRTGPGLWFGIGGVAATFAFIYGLIVVRPAMTRVAQLGALPPDAPHVERERAASEAQRLRARAATAGNLVSVLLTIAAASMAVARYM